MTTPRQRLEEIEESTLAPYAAKSSRSLGRTLHGPEPDSFRTAFQRDRDRILYSKAFKDLQYKTQVFLISEGDFYRTRLTHTLEVAQHARTLARALRLNEDLCEAIAYAHDIGHTPFGHVGEEILNELLIDDGGFEHNLQSLRIVDFLEKRYPAYDGLNLCYETREGIARHATTYDHPDVPEEFQPQEQPSLEAQVVNIADPLAYCAHDLEDALNAGYLSMKTVQKMENPLVQRVLDRCRDKYQGLEEGDTIIQARLLVRTLIEETNIMVINQTGANLAAAGLPTAEEIRQESQPVVTAPETDWLHFLALKRHLFENVYQSPQVCIMNEKGKHILRRMFFHLEKRPEMLPRTYKFRFDQAVSRREKRRVLADYLSAMTDRYAMDLYQMMFEPYEKVMFGFRDL
ncbi:MAG: deoxyguanosinetriphosphate triphosphohydrolase [Deltaproteobacteria bacterium]|nr:deoxyguanosinetriphosphate triphosphohydrolase [Deltaproteobacteria bacterium]